MTCTLHAHIHIWIHRAFTLSNRHEHVKHFLVWTAATCAEVTDARCVVHEQAVTEMLANMDALERMFDLSSFPAPPVPAGKR